VIEATLTAMGTSTLLVVEERGIPIDDAAGHGAGWQVHIEDLGTHLAGREVRSWRDRWVELIPAYETLAQHLDGAVPTTNDVPA
jgi:hypothetical protein